MDLKIWVKTLLTVHRHFNKICGAIDKLIMTKAMSSAYVSSFNYYVNNSFSVSDQIIELTERKVTLINFKIIISEILKEIPIQQSKVLILKYFDGLKSEQIADLLGISVRTYFRRLDAGHLSFKKLMISKGFSCSKLKEMLKNEKWILGVYTKFCEFDTIPNLYKFDENTEIHDFYHISNLIAK